jgi:hypothetical protein
VRQDGSAPIRRRPSVKSRAPNCLIVAAVTEFDGNSGGTSGSIGGSRLGRAFGALAGGSQSAHMAIDLRVVDATTSRVLAATSVEGEARDFNLGGALGGYTGSYALGGSLSGWKNTPREKALRQVIEASVDYVISVTPAQMMRHGAGGSPAGGAPASSGGGDRVVITAGTSSAHQGPNASSPVVFSLNSGAIVEATLRAGDWIQIRDDQGRTGWVAAGDTLDVQ